MSIEHKLIKLMLDKDFPRDEIPDTLFSTKLQPWVELIRGWFKTHSLSLTPQELYELYIATVNPVASNSQRDGYKLIIEQIEKQDVNPELVLELVRKKVEQDTYLSWGEEFIKMAEGKSQLSIEDVQTKITTFIEKHGEKEEEYVGQLPSFEELADIVDISHNWKFHVPALQQASNGLGRGTLTLVPARPDTGKSLFCISSAMHPEGFIAQGATVLYIMNEEPLAAHLQRSMCCYFGQPLEWFSSQGNEFWKDKLEEFKQATKGKLIWHHETDMNYKDVKTLAKASKADIVILDQIDNLYAPFDMAEHERLGKLYEEMRKVMITLGIAGLAVTQASDSATGKKYFGYDAIRGSRTDKAAHVDNILCVGKENNEDGVDNFIRYVNIAKRKSSATTNRATYKINPKISRMSS